MVLYLGKIIYRCHVFFLAEMYFLFVYSHFAYFRPKSGVSPTHLKWNTLIPVDMHHNNNTILSSHHHGNTFSLQWNTLIDMHYNNNTIFSSHHHGNRFPSPSLRAMEGVCTQDMHLIPKYHLTKTSLLLMSLWYSFDAQILLFKE